MTERGPETTRARSRAGRALAAFVLAWVWLSLRAPAIVQQDGSRDLAFAQDIVEGTQLRGHGTWSAFAGLLQGSVWIDFLAFAHVVGLGLEGIERLLTAVLAGSVAVASLGFSRLLAPLRCAHPPTPLERERERIGSWVGVIVMVALLPLGIEVPLLWQPLLLPLPILIAHLCLWRVLREGELLDALALGVSCAFALDVHLISVAVIGLAVVAVPLGARRPWLATAGAAAAGLATFVFSSPEVVSNNAKILAELGLLWPSLGVLGLAFVAGMVLRRPFAALAWEQRLRLALGVELAALVLVVAAAQLESTPDFAGRYLLPFLPALGLAAALVTSWARSRPALWIAAGVSLSLLVMGWPWLRRDVNNELPANPIWRGADFDPVAELLREEGVTWTEAVLRIQGPSAFELLSHLAARLEPGSPTPARAEAGLLILAYAHGEAEAVVAELPAARVRVLELDAITALILDTPARSDRAQAELCRDGSNDCTQVRLAVVSRVFQAHPNAWVGPDTSEGWLRKDERGEPEQLLWRVPVRAGSATVLSFSSRLPRRCRWEVVATEGFELEQSFPAQTLELPPAAAGALLISRKVDEEACRDSTNLPPNIVETELGWVQLRASLRAADEERAPP